MAHSRHSGERDTDGEGLPLDIVDHDQAPKPGRRLRLPSRLFLLPAMALLVFTGGVVGMYFQPPGLKAFFRLTELEPGAGSSNPIAVPPAPVETVSAPPVETVAALGRLLPEGDVSVVAPPFGAGDARIAELKVREGDRVGAGDVLAVLDSLAQLQAGVEAAKATIRVREATLAQTRDAVRASIAEAQATLQEAEAAADVARQDFDRARSLFERKVGTQSALDTARATKLQAERAVERAAATLSRYGSGAIEDQVDVVVAARNLDAARADLALAEADLAKAIVRAPISGTVLKVHARPGEKPGSDGILEIGNLDEMTVRAEVFQTQIGQVELGQPVDIVSDAFDETLTGHVTRIGLEVGRQTVIADDPAANTDARVIEVEIALDASSTPIAARYTNLEVVVRIAVGPGG